jgi:hypothetical protein
MPGILALEDIVHLQIGLLIAKKRPSLMSGCGRRMKRRDDIGLELGRKGRATH